MKRLAKAFINLGKRGLMTITRFPLTAVCLVCATALLCYMISQHQAPDLIIQKLMYTFVLGAFIGVTAQFVCERFSALSKLRIAAYLISILLIVGYYLIILPAPGISFDVTVRSLVAIFAMFCAFIWVPSFKGRFDFNNVALIHLKAAFISVLYSGVLSMGCAAIIAAIHTLLFRINNDAYGYMMAIIWVLFATVYYLSLLPHFNSADAAEQENARDASEYPQFLEVLISYIAIPLVGIYTLVFAAYFIKILVTLNWPSGQLGGMVLAYAAAGLIIYILASNLENRFTALYRLLFPRVLIPIVIMQFVSVGIRLNAYGITESRYYVTLFGIFSLVCAVLLIFKPVKRNGIIALLAAVIAIISVIPPIDAFTISRVSQINRLEKILVTEGLLVDEKIIARADASEKVKVETTSILTYLDNRDYIKYVKWLPEGFDPYSKMKKTFGFEPTYPHMVAEVANHFFVNMDTQEPFDISGYDIAVDTYSERMADKNNDQVFDFTVQGEQYQLCLHRISREEVQVLVKNAAGQELVATGLYEFTKSLPWQSNEYKGVVPSEKMNFVVENNGYKLRIMLQNVNGYMGTGNDAGIDYDILIMFGTGEKRQTM
ncbi:MAG: DUF4153 domain-containing protein [Syntrophomonadaceae bacterium]|nr:DUF4153 domain-containing protein [Syntrophomonadaceae bacterium]MDD3889948.1 DUF4153 domain-containing protein [Syntrophomonadaceae bacterium]MDD4549231.1 DUF4153 domain-containing protein [Syntrophomonadaceae bacterium]